MKYHPLHMLLVHFPVALLPMDFVFTGLGLYLGHDHLLTAGYYCLFAGTVGGWIAIVAGILDFIRFIKPGSMAVRKGLVHASIQTVVVMTFTVILMVEYKRPGLVNTSPLSLLCAKGVTVLVMLGGNYFGGELVLKHIAREFQKHE